MTGPDRAAVARDAILNLAGQSAPLVLAAFTIPSTLRLLGGARFGLLTLIWSILAAAAVVDLAVGRGVTRAVACSTRERHAAIVRAAIRLQVGVGVAGGALMLLFTPLVNRILSLPLPLTAEATSAFALVAAAIPVTLLNGCYRALFEGRQQFAAANAIRTASGMTTFLLPWLGAQLHWNLGWIVGGMIVVRAGILVVSHGIAAVPFAGVLDAGIRRELVQYGGWITVANSTLAAVAIVERLLVGKFVAVAALPQFAVPQEIVSRLSIIATSIVGAWFPRMAAAQSDDRRPERRAYIETCVAMAIPSLLLIASSTPLLTWWLGREFAAVASTPLRLLATSLVITGATTVAVAAAQVRAHLVALAVIRGIELPCFVAIQIWLIRHYGVNGAAAGVLARSLVDAIAMWTIAQRSPRALRMRSSLSRIADSKPMSFGS